MIELQRDGNHIVIDVREQIQRGMHPRGEIIKAIEEAPIGTIIDIHVPHRTQPLIASVEAMGLHVVVEELDMRHFRLRTLKML